eukprot:4803701-Amphidinium_carterae.1
MVRVAEDERLNDPQRGHYASIPTSLLQLYRDRIAELEERKQGEESLLAKALQCEEYIRQQEAAYLAEVQARRQAAAEKAKKEHREELERQAAMASIPTEQVAHAEVREPPLIGEGDSQAERAETVHSSTTGSSSSTAHTVATERMLRQQEAEEEEQYWDDIIDI